MKENYLAVSSGGYLNAAVITVCTIVRLLYSDTGLQSTSHIPFLHF
jgi:hypothetical protein